MAAEAVARRLAAMSLCPCDCDMGKKRKCVFAGKQGHLPGRHTERELLRPGNIGLHIYKYLRGELVLLEQKYLLDCFSANSNDLKVWFMTSQVCPK